MGIDIDQRRVGVATTDGLRNAGAEHGIAHEPRGDVDGLKFALGVCGGYAEIRGYAVRGKISRYFAVSTGVPTALPWR